jgi:hypothetical protein
MARTAKNFEPAGAMAAGAILVAAAAVAGRAVMGVRNDACATVMIEYSAASSATCAPPSRAHDAAGLAQSATV